VPAAILDYCRLQDLELWHHASAEAQAGAIADDIAYDAHDIDDGLRAPGCSTLTTSPDCRSPARPWTRSRGCIPASTRRAAPTSWCAA